VLVAVSALERADAELLAVVRPPEKEEEEPPAPVKTFVDKWLSENKLVRASDDDDDAARLL